MELVQLACPLCDGAFQVEVTWQGTQVACPHCEQAVTVPLLGDEPPAESPQIVVETDPTQAKRSAAAPPDRSGNEPASPRLPLSKVEALKLARRLPEQSALGSPFAVRDVSRRIQTAGGQTVELRRRTPDEQARFRRRLHLAMGLGGAAVLAVLLTVLLRLGY